MGLLLHLAKTLPPFALSLTPLLQSREVGGGARPRDEGGGGRQPLARLVRRPRGRTDGPAVRLSSREVSPPPRRTLTQPLRSRLTHTLTIRHLTRKRLLPHYITQPAQQLLYANACNSQCLPDADSHASSPLFRLPLHCSVELERPVALLQTRLLDDGRPKTEATLMDDLLPMQVRCRCGISGVSNRATAAATRLNQQQQGSGTNIRVQAVPVGLRHQQQQGHRSPGGWRRCFCLRSGEQCTATA